MASVLAELFTEEGGGKKMYRAFEESLFTPNRATNLLTPTQKSTIEVTSVAANALFNSMSKVEEHRALLEDKLIENDLLKKDITNYKKQLRIENTLDNSSTGRSSMGFKFNDPNSTPSSTTTTTTIYNDLPDLPCPMMASSWAWYQ